MDVSSMVIYVSSLLGDTSNQKWTSSTHIVPALNSAQEEFIIKILGYLSQNRNAYDVLSELQASKSSASVATTGYALSGVDSTPGPVMRNGVIAVSCTLDSVTRWCQKMDIADLEKQRNYYFKGNDERPKYYVFNEILYIVASTGSYPITATFYYIREPKALVASGASGYQVTTCELNGIYHRLISEIAAANCWRMLGDESSSAKYDRIMQRIEPRIQGIAMSGVVGVKIEDKEIK